MSGQDVLQLADLQVAAAQETVILMLIMTLAMKLCQSQNLALVSRLHVLHSLTGVSGQSVLRLAVHQVEIEIGAAT